jgi:uncharacterized short protein YbdD (DUF466 family)
MKSFAVFARKATVRFWCALRQIFGDAAYENYLRSLNRAAGQHGSPITPLTPEEFYLDSLRRRYSQINRCC